jgi:hypothetical protein
MYVQPVENKALVLPIPSKLRINSFPTSKGIERSYEYVLNLRLMKYLGSCEARSSAKKTHCELIHLDAAALRPTGGEFADFFDS